MGVTPLTHLRYMQLIAKVIIILQDSCAHKIDNLRATTCCI